MTFLFFFLILKKMFNKINDFFIMWRLIKDYCINENLEVAFADFSKDELADISDDNLFYLSSASENQSAKPPASSSSHALYL